MDLKYTNDGKKVAVIGKLNAQETIVQEIFIVNNQEVPSGENFVVKSLHDAPAVSWHSKEEKRLSDNIERLKSSYEAERLKYESLQRNLKIQYESVKAQLSYLNKVVKSHDNINLSMVEMFLSGELNYIVWEGYQLDIFSFNKGLAQTTTHWSEEQYEDIKLLSLFGKDDGSMNWRVNNYYDGSGSWTKISGFKTLDEAKCRLLELIIQKGVMSEHVKVAKKHGIELPKSALDMVKKREIDSVKQRIDTKKSELERLNAELLEKENL